MMYVHQTKPIFYRVKVNLDGQKTWAEYPYIVPNQDEQAPITRADLKALEEQFAEQISELKRKLSSEVSNEQSHG